jgi:hypothetical protein
MNYSSRFFLYAPLCMFLGLAAFVMVHWWTLATAFDKKLDAFKGHDAVPGIVIDWQTKTLSGFPFRLDVVFTGLKVHGAGAHGPFAWRSDAFALHALTYGRPQQIFEASGVQSLAWTDPDGSAHSLAFLPAALHASAISDTSGLAQFDLDILDASGKDARGNPFTAGRLQFHLRRNPKQDKLDLAASGDEIRDAGGIGAFGPHLRSLQVMSALSHGTSLAGLLKGQVSWPEAASDWRKQGGNVNPDRQGFAAAQTQAAEALLSPLY